MQPVGATSPSQLLRLGESHRIARVTRMSLGGQKAGSLIAGVSAWGLDTGTSPFRESSEHSHKWGLKLQSRTRTRLERLSSSSSSSPACQCTVLCDVM